MLGTTLTAMQIVNLIVGVLLPIGVALITKYETQPQVRAILLLALSCLTGILNSWLAGPVGFDWAQAIWSAVTVFIIGVATLFGLWKPTGVNDAAKHVGQPVSGTRRRSRVSGKNAGGKV